MVVQEWYAQSYTILKTEECTNGARGGRGKRIEEAEKAGIGCRDQSSGVEILERLYNTLQDEFEQVNVDHRNARQAIEYGKVRTQFSLQVDTPLTLAKHGQPRLSRRQS